MSASRLLLCLIDGASILFRSRSSKLSIPVVLSKITEKYSPNIVATVNYEYDTKIARTKGDFVWHSHPDTDEFFYILSGSLTTKVDGKEGNEVVVSYQGEIFTVPKGVRQRPAGDAEIMLTERSGEVNTGDAKISEFTREVNDARVIV
ncbi:hypothetical protein ONS96_013661 [Cadophora gregata f. sp. sojae]|nr:hypothetical protein ONS96_013661 [Cadophora gregata f. sp. sojae]